MAEKTSIPRGVFYLAAVTAFLTWLLIMLGGIVHGTGSSLACPDWPTCYGSFFPEMKGTIFFEHSHRLLAASIGLLTIGLLVSCWRRGKALRALCGLALVLVVFQGILGGITVLYRLPPAVSTGHLATSMLFFALLVWIAALCYAPRPQSLAPEKEGPAKGSGVRTWILISLLFVYLQIVLGGMLRHLGAGLACVDLPLCQGSLWPAEAPPLLKVHMVHRLFAVFVALSVMITSWKLLWNSRGRPGLRFLAILAQVLVLTQIGLGLLTISTALELLPTTAHLGVGALLWVNLVLLYFVWTSAEEGATSSVRGTDYPLLGVHSLSESD